MYGFGFFMGSQFPFLVGGVADFRVQRRCKGCKELFSFSRDVAKEDREVRSFCRGCIKERCLKRHCAKKRRVLKHKLTKRKV